MKILTLEGLVQAEKCADCPYHRVHQMSGKNHNPQMISECYFRPKQYQLIDEGFYKRADCPIREIEISFSEEAMTIHI